MPAQISFIHNDDEWRSATNPDMSAKDMAEEVYKEFQNMSKFMMQLEGGEYVMFGEKALSSGVFVFKDIK